MAAASTHGSTPSGSRSSRSRCATSPGTSSSSTGSRTGTTCPREWLKKVALMDDVYLLNSPFTFQAMEKHAAYCAMMRLGLKMPETVLVPYKHPPDNARLRVHRRTVQPAVRPPRDRRRPRLPAVHEAVRRRRLASASRGSTDEAELHARLRRLGREADAPAGADRRTTCSPARCRSGPRRWSCASSRTSRCTTATRSTTTSSRPRSGDECVTINRVVNAFFRWEFNSCEMLVKSPTVTR